MSSNTLVKGVIVSCIYAIFQYIESHFITKEPIKLKALVQNILIVYISYVAGVFIYDQIEPIKISKNAPSVFTADPDF